MHLLRRWTNQIYDELFCNSFFNVINHDNYKALDHVIILEKAKAK